jgi:squalene-hopene/tetraprenyl-beta-curcumene cyclase
MTYAGLKSYIYAMPAQLTRDDPRVQQAMDWIRNNYTLKRNPGMPKDAQHQGQYYYYMTFGRAMDAWGASTITTADGETHDWANDLVDALAKRQQDNGSWINTGASRWMEDNPDLVTAYALIALQQAVD